MFALLLGSGAIAGPASAAPTTLAPVSDDTPLSAYGGWVLWSERRPDGRWALTGWHDGAKSRLAVRSRAVPFDVDVGPDRAGKPVALYTRCARDPISANGSTTTFWGPNGVPQWSLGAGCRIQRLNLTTGTEIQLPVPRTQGASDEAPSEWYGRIVFGRRTSGSDLTQILLWSPSSRRLRRLPGGHLPRNCPFRSGCKREPFDGDVLQLDLGPLTLALSWRAQAPAIYGVGVSLEIFAIDLRSTTRTLLSAGEFSGACGALSTGSPNAAGAGVWFFENSYDCEVVRTFVAFGDRKVWGQIDAAPDLLWQLARDGANLYSIRGSASASVEARDPPCTTGTDPCHLAVETTSLEAVPLVTGRHASPPFG